MTMLTAAYSKTINPFWTAIRLGYQDHIFYVFYECAHHFIFYTVVGFIILAVRLQQIYLPLCYNCSNAYSHIATLSTN